MRFTDSHISMSTSCKSTRLKKSTSDWLKSREVGNSIRVKRCDFCVFVSQGSAERDIIKMRLENKPFFDCLDSFNACAKNYKNPTVLFRVIAKNVGDPCSRYSFIFY